MPASFLTSFVRRVEISQAEADVAFAVFGARHARRHQIDRVLLERGDALGIDDRHLLQADAEALGDFPRKIDVVADHALLAVAIAERRGGFGHPDDEAPACLDVVELVGRGVTRGQQNTDRGERNVEQCRLQSSHGVTRVLLTSRPANIAG